MTLELNIAAARAVTLREVISHEIGMLVRRDNNQYKIFFLIFMFNLNLSASIDFKLWKALSTKEKPFSRGLFQALLNFVKVR